MQLTHSEVQIMSLSRAANVTVCQGFTRSLILGLAALLASSLLAKAGDIAAGRKVMEKCQGCHGKDGLGGQPFIPNIAGQKEFYFVQSLMAYKAGNRKSQSMSDALKGLSDEDMANVAAYYAAIKLTVKVP